MSFGIRQLLLTNLLIISLGTAAAAEADLPTLLSGLSRPTPETVPFVEVRFSSLLTQPLVVKGDLERRSDGSLVRNIRAPYQETATLLGDNVSVVRDGERPRRFSLERAPALRVLVDGFGAILRGDADTLQKTFYVSAEEFPRYWSIVLTAKDARLRSQFSRIQLDGQGRNPRCLALQDSDGDTTVMTMGAGISGLLQSPISPESLRSVCTG